MFFGMLRKICSRRERVRICKPNMGMEELEKIISFDASVGDLFSHDVLANASDLPQFSYADHRMVLITDSLAATDGVRQAIPLNTHVVVVDTQHDNFSTINKKIADAVIAGGEKIGSLAVLAHAEKGQIILGTDKIDLANAHEFKPQLEELGKNMAEKGQIQLFGCSVAGDVYGQGLVEVISVATHTDVFASTNTTGYGPDKDWTLEYSTNPGTQMNTVVDTEQLAALPVDLAATMKAAYADLTGDPVVTLFPPQGVAPLDVIVLGFADVNRADPKPTFLKDMREIVEKTFGSAGKSPEIFFSIGGEHTTPEAIAAAGGAEQVAKNVIEQVKKYNEGLKNSGGGIVGIDLDLERNIDKDTINLMAKTIHEKNLKVSIAPQVFAYAVQQPDKTWKAYVDSENPTNLVLTSGPEANTYGDAIKNGYVDQIMVQAYNQGQYYVPPYFKVDGYAENQVESFKSTSRALNVWASGDTYFPIPEKTKIFMGSVANQIAGGYTIFNPEAKQIPYAYDDQKILDQLKGDILTMQEDPVKYGRISGVFFWSLSNDYSPKLWSDQWAKAGGFSTTIFGAEPVPERPYNDKGQYIGNYANRWK